MIPLDADWLRDNPLPKSDADTDKNERGRVCVVGGSSFVPGALRLTGEAALRAGAGKLQMGTVREAALALGMFVPEAGVFALPSDEDGELDRSAAGEVIEHARSCDALVLGPGMRNAAGCSDLVRGIVEGLPASVSAVLDAAAIPASRDCAQTIRSYAGPKVITPHHGEMAALTGCEASYVERNGEQVARQVAGDLKAVVALKSARTIIAGPGDECLIFEDGTPGLATGGSGDVLAGMVGGLLARGAEPLTATAWAVWAHGRIGQILTEQKGGPGLLGRELIDLIPAVLNSVQKQSQPGS